MHVNKTIETEDGTVKFEGELTQAEADLVIKVGLSTLLGVGALSVSLAPNDDGEQTLQ